MTLNKEKMMTLVGEAHRALGMLEGYREEQIDGILQNSEKLSAIKYQFVVLAEACIDICNHVAARVFAQTPESYVGCFELLGQRSVIDSSLVQRMGRLAGLRNLLVHLYWKVDDRRVIEVLRKDLGSVREYLAVMTKLASEA